MRKILNFITTVIFVILIAFAGVLLAPRIFGVQPMAVLSGSMEPTYHVGSLIYVKEGVSKDDIEIGDPITFKINDETIVTHRVVEIDAEGNYITKGDANEANDGGSVSFANVVGMPVFTIPYLGFLASYATTKTGLIILVTAILVILLLTFLPDLLGMDEDEKKEVSDTNEE